MEKWMITLFSTIIVGIVFWSCSNDENLNNKLQEIRRQNEIRLNLASEKAAKLEIYNSVDKTNKILEFIKNPLVIKNNLQDSLIICTKIIKPVTVKSHPYDDDYVRGGDYKKRSGFFSSYVEKRRNYNGNLVVGDKVILLDYLDGYWLIENKMIAGYIADSAIEKSNTIEIVKVLLIKRNEEIENKKQIELNALETGMWEIEKYRDEFGDLTKDKFITNKKKIYGISYNPETRDLKIGVYVGIDNKTRILLVDSLGNSLIKQSSNDPFIIKVKDKNDKVHKLNATGISRRLVFDSESHVAFDSILYEGGMLKFVVINSNNPTEEYHFKMDNIEFFDNVYEQYLYLK